MKKIKNKIHLFLAGFLPVAVVFATFLVGFKVLAVWQEPNVAPPAGNVAAPLNVGSTGQTKTGALTVSNTVTADKLCFIDNTDCRNTWADILGPWLSAQYGIYYNNGNVGIGSVPLAWARLVINMGTADDKEGLHISRGVAVSYNYSYLNIEDQLDSPVFKVHQSGNVGIGIAEPGAKLEVTGQVKITGGVPGDGKVLTSDADGLASWQLPATGDISGNGTPNSVAKFITSKTIGDSLILDDGTNVGIGLTDPGQKLDIDGALRIRPQAIAPAGSSNNGVIYYDSVENKFKCYEASGWKDCISGAGAGTNYWTQTGAALYPNNLTWNVGIGDASPVSLLTVGDGDKFQVNSSGNLTSYGTVTLRQNTTGNTLPLRVHAVDAAEEGNPALIGSEVALFQRNYTSAYGASIAIVGGSNGVSQVYFGDKDDIRIGRVVYNHANNSLALYTNNAVALTILSDGNTGVGAITPTQKLEVNGGLKIASSVGGTAGTISYSSNDFWGYDGATWKSFTATGGGALPAGTSGQTLRYDNTNNLIANSVIYNNGTNVGIGTASPGAYKLNVAGDLVVSGANNDLFVNAIYGRSGTAENIWLGDVDDTVVVNNKIKIVGGSPALGKVLTSDTAGLASWTATSSLGLVAAAAGNNGEVQYNDNGLLGASSNFYWDNVNNRLMIGNASKSYLYSTYINSGMLKTDLTSYSATVAVIASGRGTFENALGVGEDGADSYISMGGNGESWLFESQNGGNAGNIYLVGGGEARNGGIYGNDGIVTIGNSSAAAKRNAKLNVYGQICINDVCQSSWPGGAAGGGWTDDGTIVRLTTITDKVGLGTVSPAEKLEVNDTTAGAARLRITDTSQNPEIQLHYGAGASDHWAIYNNQSDDSLKIWNTGGDRLTIKQDGSIWAGIVSKTIINSDGSLKMDELDTNDFDWSTSLGALPLIATGNNTCGQVCSSHNLNCQTTIFNDTDFCFQKPDFNGVDSVNAVDIQLVTNCSLGIPSGCSICDDSEGKSGCDSSVPGLKFDLNGDNIVDVADIRITKNWSLGSCSGSGVISCNATGGRRTCVCD